MENEFSGRASELQRMESDLQTKMQRYQRDGSTMKAADRTKLEKDIQAQRQDLAQKGQAFEQDQARRSNEERGKLMTKIQAAVKKVASDQAWIWLFLLTPLSTTAMMLKTSLLMY
jgi:outer membrane protein